MEKTSAIITNVSMPNDMFPLEEQIQKPTTHQSQSR